jgi:hypothetical protein
MKQTIAGLAIIGSLMWIGAMIQIATRLANQEGRLQRVESLCVSSRVASVAETTP